MPEDTTKPTSDSPSFFRSGVREPVLLTPGLEPGKIVGDFELRTLLGQGGMGQVWEANQLSLSRQVAVKFVRPERVTKHQLELFAREARAGGRLSHSGIVAVYGHGESDGLAWIAMELVPGAWDLRDFLDEVVRMGDVPVGYDKKVAQFIAKVADAVQAAHDAGVIHRDLKPQNILITESDDPKVTDFGLARIVDEQALSHTGDFAGTYFYMSPEQVAAKRAGLDHRTDVFSLGIVLYEMLSLVRPFQGDTEHQVAEQILMKDPTDPKSLRSKVPRDLAVICMKALEKDRDKRFDSIGDVAADLRRWLANKPILAKPPNQVERVAKWCKRNPTKSVAAGLASAAMIAITLLLAENWRTNSSLLQSNDSLSVQTALAEARAEHLVRLNLSLEKKTTEAERNAREAADSALSAKQNEANAIEERDRASAAESLAEQSVYTAYMNAAMRELQNGNTAGFRLAHDACATEYRGWEWHHLNLARDSSIQSMEGHEGEVHSIAWNSEGTRIVSGSSDETVRLWNAQTGDIELILTGHERKVSSVAWSPDGTRIVSGSFDKTIRVWDSITGECLKVLRGHSGPVTSLALDSLGQHVISGSWDKSVRLWNIDNGLVVQTFEGHESWISSVAFDSTNLFVVAGAGDGQVRQWGIEDGELQLRLSAHSTGEVFTAKEPNGERFVTGGADGLLSLWDTESGDRLITMTGHDSPVTSVAWNSSGSQILSGSSNGNMKVWDSGTGEELLSIDELDSQILCVAWRPATTSFVSATSDTKIRVWDAQMGTNLQKISISGFADRKSQSTAPGVKFGMHYNTAVWSEDGNTVASSQIGEGLHTRNANSGETILRLSNEPESALAWDPSGGSIFLATYSNLKIVDVLTGRTLLMFDDFPQWGEPQSFRSDISIVSASWSRLGSKIVSVAMSGRVDIWDAENGKNLLTFRAGSFSIYTVAWNPNGTRVLTGDPGGDVVIWDAHTGKKLFRLEGHSESITSSEWSYDGNRIATASTDKSIRIWDSQTGTCLATLRGHLNEVSSVRWNKSGSRLASGSMDGTVRVWSPHSDQSLITLSGHDAGVTSVAWSDDGTRIRSIGGSTICIWESRVEEALPMWRAAAARKE
jgi:WD40 repeat protein/serine/threonine protein kinase